MTQEELQAIEDCGAAEMPLDETCLICEINPDEFERNEEVRKAYRRGQLKSKLKIRQAVVKMAQEGVPQMVKIYQDFGGTALPPRRGSGIDADDDVLFLEDDDNGDGTEE